MIWFICHILGTNDIFIGFISLLLINLLTNCEDKSMRKKLYIIFALSLFGTFTFANVSTVENDSPAKDQLKKVTSLESGSDNNLHDTIIFDSIPSKNFWVIDGFPTADEKKALDKRESTYEAIRSSDPSASSAHISFGRDKSTLIPYMMLYCPVGYYLPNLPNKKANGNPIDSEYEDLLKGNFALNFGSSKYFERVMKVLKNEHGYKSDEYDIAEITVYKSTKRVLKYLSSKGHSGLTFKHYADVPDSVKYYRIYCFPSGHVSDYSFDRLTT